MFGELFLMFIIGYVWVGRIIIVGTIFCGSDIATVEFVLFDDGGAIFIIIGSNGLVVQCHATAFLNGHTMAAAGSAEFCPFVKFLAKDYVCKNQKPYNCQAAEESS